MIADSQQFITQQIKVESVYQFDLNQSSSSIKENHIHQVQSQNLHQIELDNYHGKKSSKDNVFYKKQLLQLMVMVKLEKYGLQKRETKPLIAREMEKIQHIQLIENKSLNQLAMEMSQNVLFHVFQEIVFQLPRFRRLRSLMKVQTDNESQIQRQRADFMPERQQIQRSQHLAPEILCSICYTVSNRYLSQSCGHSFCMDCINGYLSQNLSSGNFIVKCPEFDCKQFISNDNIKKALQKKDNQKFLYFKQKYQKENNPENKFCTKPDCGQLLVSINDCLKCNKCSEEYCEICLLKYHGNNPCDIALKNALQQDFKTFKIKKCPNCKSPIEKSDGCNHMCCKKCKFQFCWICLKKYTTHHYRYYNCFGCPGMQFENENQLIYQRCKQITFFCLLPFVIFLLFVCFLSAIPIYMVGSFIYKPCHWLHEDKDYCQYIIASKICCCFGQLIIKIFAWFLYLPRALLYMAFVAPVRLTISFCIEICKIFQ